jgi:alpha-1,6-mannosyltransferase
MPARNSDNEPLAALTATALLLAFLTAQAAVLVDQNERSGFVALSLASAMIYLVAVVAILKHPGGRSSVLIILAVALVLRALAMTSLPNLTSDAFRYVWDGRLGWEGLSPYLYVPADERLAHLRDTAIYPHINQKDDAVSIYPPVAEMVFMAGVAIEDGIGGMKVTMLAFEAATILALIGWLRSEGLPPSRVLIYAWHPLPIWHFASQAHIDAAATAFLSLGIWACIRRRQGLTGTLFALAALVKYFPLVLLPALWRRWDLRLPIALLATAFAIYLPYVLGAGSGVIGFLGQHLDNEGYRSGWGFHAIWYLRDFGIADPPVWLYLIPAGSILIAMAWWAMFFREADEFRPERMVLLGAAFAFLTCPHYPWYFGFLCALAVRVPHPALLVMTVTCLTFDLPRTNGTTWSEIYALTYAVPLIVWGLWEAGVRLNPGWRQVEARLLRLDTHATKL